LAILLALAGVACLVVAVRASLRPPLRDALVLLGYAILALAYAGLWSDFTTRFRAGNDPVQDAWVLSTVTTNALTRPARLFDGNVFFPAYESVLYADPLLGPAALVLPLRAFTDDPAVLYNSALLAGLALAGYGFFRLGLHLTGDAGASLLAGISLPYASQQMHHMELAHLPYLSIAGFPFLILGLLQLLERPGPRPALLTGLAFAFQAGTDGYYAFCSAFLALLVACWGWRRLVKSRAWLWAGAAALVGVTLILPYVLGFAGKREEAEMTRGLEWSLAYSTDLKTSLFRSDALLYRGLLDGANPSKGGPLFPGLLVAGLAGFALRRVRRPEVSLLLIVIGFFFLLSLGPELRFGGRSLFPLPFKVLFENVPFFNAMRHPTTLALPALMALSLLAVLGLAALGWARRAAALALLLCVAVAETLTATPARIDRGRELPEAYVFLRSQPPGAILELPFEGNYGYEWWAIRHGMPIVNGELGFEPRWFAQLFHVVNREWDRRPPHQDMEDWNSVRFLKGQIPLRYLILHRGVSGFVRTNVEATGRTFELIRETKDGAAVYRVRRGGVGPELRRRFRDDQLAGRRIVARLRGPAGSSVSGLLNDVALGERELSPEARDLEWELPAGAIAPRALNVFTLRASDGAARFELLDLEAGPIR
jgi:hypothetical protein